MCYSDNISIINRGNEMSGEYIMPIADLINVRNEMTEIIKQEIKIDLIHEDIKKLLEGVGIECTCFKNQIDYITGVVKFLVGCEGSSGKILMFVNYIRKIKEEVHILECLPGYDCHQYRMNQPHFYCLVDEEFLSKKVA